MKAILLLVSFVFLSGCYQTSAALVGPAYTLGSTGNIYQAGFTYGLNASLEKTTGMSTTDHAKKILSKIGKKKEKLNIYTQQQKEKIKKGFEVTKAEHEAYLAIVKANIEKTRGKLLD